MTAIERLEDLRPGDIMFGPIGGLVGAGVGLGQMLLGEGWAVGPLKIRHVGIVVKAADPLWLDGPKDNDPDWRRQYAPRLVQAMPGGAEEISMRYSTHWTNRHAYVRLPEDWPGQAADAAAIARLMVSEGVSYSFASYAALAAWKFGFKAERLKAWIGRRRPEIAVPAHRGTYWRALPCEAICSVLVDQAWTLAGKKVMDGVPHQCVTPGALAARLLFETPGVVWGTP